MKLTKWLSKCEGSLLEGCTVLVVGSDDVAPSYSVGVLTRRQIRKRGGSRGGSWSRQLLSWRVPIFSIPESAITGLKMKSPDINSGDQAIGDRQSKHIARDEGGADYEGGRRDHREGVRRHPNSPVPVEIALPS